MFDFILIACVSPCDTCTSSSYCSSCDTYYAIQTPGTCSYCPPTELAYKSVCHTTCPSKTYNDTNQYGARACHGNYIEFFY